MRYSQIDLTDKDVFGGKERDWTFGINWYLNPNIRFMFNYVLGTVDRLKAGQTVDGDLQVYRFKWTSSRLLKNAHLFSPYLNSRGKVRRPYFSLTHEVENSYAQFI